MFKVWLLRFSLLFLLLILGGIVLQLLPYLLFQSLESQYHFCALAFAGGELCYFKPPYSQIGIVLVFAVAGVVPLVLFKNPKK
jgi:hypothetical protein